MDPCVLTVISAMAIQTFMADNVPHCMPRDMPGACSRGTVTTPPAPTPLYTCTRSDGTTYTRIGDTPPAAPIP